MVLTDCQLPNPNHGHVVLADPSPILLYQVGQVKTYLQAFPYFAFQIGTHDTRILVDVPGKLPSIGNGDLKRHMQDHIGPQLPKSIQV